ncbi:MAG: hypothetical protein ACFWUC_07470 [Oscillospiraceae bacterium]|jgi:hypothetical protein
MEIPEIISGLEDLIKDREALMDDDCDSVFAHDKEVLEAAVQILTRNECYGCGYEHNCKDGHCALMTQAADALEHPNKAEPTP